LIEKRKGVAETADRKSGKEFGAPLDKFLCALSKKPKQPALYDAAGWYANAPFAGSKRRALEHRVCRKSAFGNRTLSDLDVPTGVEKGAEGRRSKKGSSCK
jgi:hypothetical protein